MEKLIEGIAATLGFSSFEELADQLKQDGKWLEDTAAGTKLSAIISERMKAAKQEQHKRGVRETSEGIEKFIKAKGFENPENLKGQDLIDAYAAWKISESKPDPKKVDGLSPEELKKLPAVQDLVKAEVQKVSERLAAVAAEYDSFKQEVKTKTVLTASQKRAQQILEEEGAILEVPGAGVKKEDRLRIFFQLMDPRRLGVDEKNEPILVNDKGEPELDDYGKPLSFKKYVVDLNSGLFGFQKRDPKKGSASPKPGDNTGGDAKMKFASAADFDKYLTNEPDGAKRLAAQEAYVEQLAAGEIE